jgi:hypothetical protein
MKHFNMELSFKAYWEKVYHFSDRGPNKCSGLFIRKYSEDMLVAEFQGGFEKIRRLQEDHATAH